MTPTKLSSQHCKPCSKGTRPLAARKAKRLLKDLTGWRLGNGGKALAQIYRMKDFLSALEFMKKIAQVAEAEDHHPDLHLTGYRKLRIVLSTHSIGGLSKNDFILASKIDRIPAGSLLKTPQK